MSVLASGTATAHHTPDGPYWTELALPAGTNGNASAIGTTVVLTTGSAVHCWSGITREWTVVPSTSGLVSNFNAYAIIEEGNTLHGFSSRTGAVDSINLPGYTLMHGPQFASWVSVAFANNEVWGFSAFLGKWIKQTIQTASPTVSIGSLCAVVHDGVNAYGFSSYHGTWVPVAAPGSPTLEANGVVAVANDPGVARCFSAHTNSWSTTAFGNTASLVTQRGYAMFTSGTQILAFSGYKGFFATHTANSPAFSNSMDRNVAAIVDGNDVTCYSAGTGTFATRSFASFPVVSLDADLGAVTDGNELVGFSVVTGAFSAPVAGSFLVSTNDAVAYATGAAGEFAYSLVENQWFPAPVLGAGVELIRNAVILIDSNGYHGFIGRTGNWITKASSSPSSYVVNNSGDTFVGLEGNELHMFDPRIERFTTTSALISPSVALHRTVAIAEDGTNAYGFGLMNNVWDEVPLQGNVTFVKASSSCGVVQTDTHVYTFTAHGSFSTLSRFPEFSRYQPIGDEMRLIQAAPAGSFVTSLIGLAPTFQPVGGLGNLFVDPSFLIIGTLGVVPAGDLMTLEIPVPDVPSLNGLTVHMQNYIVPPAGAPWLTNSIAPVLF